MNRRLLPFVALMCLMSFLAHPARGLSQATPTPAQPALATPIAIDETSALLAKAVDDPLWVVGSDGMIHLEYDLLFTNVFPAPVTLTPIVVLTPDGQVLLTLEGDALLAMTQPPFGGAPSTVVQPSSAVVTMLDIVLPPGLVPERVTHRITYALPANDPANELIGSTEILWPDILVEAGPPLVIASPLRGTGWLNINGCCGPSPHRSARLTVDGSHILDYELFAIDWIKLEGDVAYAGDGSRNEDHFAYGETVFSVADGTVTLVRDGVPDHAPFTRPPLRVPSDYGGNQIIVYLDSGEYAVYANLLAGSVRAQPGDRIETGDILGLVGNSGDSAIPHLHFQLSGGPGVTTSVSLPFVIDTWTLEGIYPDASRSATRTGIDGAGSPQTETLPMQNTVANFP